MQNPFWRKLKNCGVKPMFYSDDPVADFARHDWKQNQALQNLPRCERCRKPIQDEYLYLINDEFICPACLDRDFRKDVNDYIQ